MSAVSEQPPANELLAQLREEFDRSFTLPPAPAGDAGAEQNFVLVLAASTRYALRSAGLAGIEHASALVPAPSRKAALLGLAGVRGAIVPIFSLAGLFGLEGEPPARWWRSPIFALVSLADELSGGETTSSARAIEAVGLAFDELLQFVRVPVAELTVELAEGGQSSGPPSAFFHQGELFRIIDPHTLIQQQVIEDSSETRHP